MRKLATDDGILRNGHPTSPSDVEGNPQSRVYLVAEADTLSVLHVLSPHLADPQQAKDFEMQVIEGETEAGA